MNFVFKTHTDITWQLCRVSYLVRLSCFSVQVLVRLQSRFQLDCILLKNNFLTFIYLKGRENYLLSSSSFSPILYQSELDRSKPQAWTNRVSYKDGRDPST